jgi:hypothetical protein
LTISGGSAEFLNMLTVSDLSEILVFGLDDLLEIVQVDELQNAVGCQIPGLRRLHVGQCLDLLACLLENLRGEKEPRAFSTEPAVAAGRMDDPTEQAVEVADVEKLFGDTDEIGLVAEEAPNEGDAERSLPGEGELESLRAEMVESLDRIGDLA